MDGTDRSDEDAIPVKERIEFLTKTYDRMAGLATNADAKAGFILAIHAFWAISYGPNLQRLIISFRATPVKVTIWGLSFLPVVTFFLAFIFSVEKAAVVLSPRIGPQENEPSRRPGLIYFADIIKLEGSNVSEKACSYKTQFEEMNYDDVLDELTYRINDIARVVYAKYACAGEAVRCSIRTFYLWAVSLIGLMIMNMLLGAPK